MEQKYTGIVLRTVKYNDTSVIADLYTAESGRISLLAPIPRSRKSLVRTSLLQPLAILEVEACTRPSGLLSRIKEARVALPLLDLPFHPHKSAIALFLAEFIHRSIREEEANLPLFAYLQHAICWLDACRTSFANFHLVFLLRLSRFIGLWPNTEGYQDGDWFDLYNACFTHQRPTHAAILPPDEAKAVRHLMRMNFDTMHLFAMNHHQRNRCLEVILNYYRLHLPGLPELKSVGVLQELFS
ncbi:MAG: DNA repair protein RecO [Bacteroidaceae bacterium]